MSHQHMHSCGDYDADSRQRCAALRQRKLSREYTPSSLHESHVAVCGISKVTRRS